MEIGRVKEAFAPQYLAVERELGLHRARTNVHGGAIAIGHPLAASGTRITIHLLHALRQQRKRFGLGSACIGGGQGAAVIVEAYPARGRRETPWGPSTSDWRSSSPTCSAASAGCPSTDRAATSSSA